MQTSSKDTAAARAEGVGACKGGGDDSREGRSRREQRTERSDGLHVEVLGLSTARCQEQIPTQRHGWWYHSPREEVLGEDQVSGGRKGKDRECELRYARLEMPFRLPEGDLEMHGRDSSRRKGSAVANLGC